MVILLKGLTNLHCVTKLTIQRFHYVLAATLWQIMISSYCWNSNSVINYEVSCFHSCVAVITMEDQEKMHTGCQSTKGNNKDITWRGILCSEKPMSAFLVTYLERQRDGDRRMKREERVEKIIIVMIFDYNVELSCKVFEYTNFSEH